MIDRNMKDSFSEFAAKSNSSLTRSFERIGKRHLKVTINLKNMKSMFAMNYSFSLNFYINILKTKILSLGSNRDVYLSLIIFFC
jgi:hypothetical protein